MIPIKLELTNFLSYGATETLDFSGIEMACIAGMNGAGKSSLLEGITWALFGQSRSKDVDGVVNRLAVGRGEYAEVRFSFELANNQYQLIRRRKSRGSTTLEFQIKSEHSWKTLSEKSVTETQEIIKKTLNMDYETFINVSFFLQGKADQFTTKSPGERKAVLSNLLGVSQWNEYKLVAAESIKTEKSELGFIDRTLAEIENELTTRQSREEQLALAKAQLQHIDLQVKHQELMVHDLRRRAEEAKHQKTIVDDLAQQQKKVDGKLPATRKILQEKEQERANHQKLLAKRLEIEQAMNDYEALQKTDELWQEKSMAYAILQQSQQLFVRNIEKEKSRLEQEQRNLAKKAETIATYRQELETCQARLASAESTFSAIQHQLEQLKEKEIEYQSARDQLLQIDNERMAWQKEVESWQKEADEAKRLRVEQAKLIADSAELPDQIGRLTAQLETMSSQKEQLSHFSAEHTMLESAQKPLKTRMDELKTKITHLEQERSGNCTRCGQPITPNHVAQVVSNINAEGKPLGDEYRANRERLDELKRLIPALEKETKSISQLAETLRTKQQRQIESTTRLSSIERTLALWDESGKEIALQRSQERLADQSGWQAQKTVVDNLQRALEPKAALIAKQREWERNMATDQAIIARNQKEIAQWVAEGEPASAEITRRLQENQYEQLARQQLAQVEAEMQAIGYDATAHQSVRQQKTELKTAPEQFKALQIAKTAISFLDGEIEQLTSQQKEQEEELGRLGQRLVTDRARLDGLLADIKDADGAETMLNELRQQLKKDENRVRDAEQRVEVLDDLVERKKIVMNDRNRTAQKIGRLQLIEQACGPNGIQALLIEQALPEIEDRANELLLRLTNGEMQLLFNTQKKLKKDDSLTETLEITISDNNGERPYENFSGGEQFRINFALRLALSQLLAKRAGTKLQTLIIDEGFGSQDPVGRQRLIEAINIIRPDFERILVITHVEELRDAFATRIEVIKGREGSHIVIHR